MAAPLLESVRESDFVEYFLFPDKFDDASLCDEELHTFRRSQLQGILTLAEEFTAGHIWQKDAFNLNLRDSTNVHLADDSEFVDQALGAHLHGVTHFGDNVEDEWLIVALLLSLTSRVPGLVCRVADDDGEFLLIEAADWLPSWADPEACAGRVFLFQGSVHIVPPNKQVSDIRGAVDAVRDVAVATQVDDAIQKAVEARTQGYPERALAQLHRVRARVPVAVAALLNAKPQLVADAVRAFCERDPLDAKTVRAMRWFPPEVTVVTVATMPRCLYAKLRHAHFVPDRRTGWALPPATDPEHPVTSLGIKLACGFEILVAESRRHGNERGWQRYLDGLGKRGYFEGLLPGSMEHAARTATAREYFDSRRDVIESRCVADVASLLDSLHVDVAALRAQEHSLPPSDDDSWLEISPADVDAMIASRCGPADDETDVASRLTAFLEHASEVGGAEFPAAGPKAPPRRRKAPPPNKAPPPAENEAVTFDSEAFSCAVHNILDLVVPEDDWSSDGSMSSYEGEGDTFDPTRSEMKQYMDQMDREVAAATQQESDFADVEVFEPVDVDMRAVAGVLESYRAQLGGPGPAGNLLGPMGVRPPMADTSP